MIDRGVDRAADGVQVRAALYREHLILAITELGHLLAQFGQ